MPLSETNMARTSGLSPTREGLLHDRWTSSQRQSYEEPHRSSIDSEGLTGESEFHHTRPEQGIFEKWAQRWFGRYRASEQAYDDRKSTGSGTLSRKQKPRGCCSRYKICFITFGVLLGLFMILSGSGVLWVYKKSPKDGVGVSSRRLADGSDCVRSNRPLGIRPLKEVLSGHGRKATRRLRSW